MQKPDRESSSMIPLRWPDEWVETSAVDLVKGTGVGCLLINAETKNRLGPAMARAEAEGFKLVDTATPPPGVSIVKADWPGARAMGRSRGALADSTREPAISAGPTGEPWVDSLGWVVQLSMVKQPSNRVWVDAQPKGGVVSPEAYLRAVSDAAANGGRWIISIDKDLAAGLQARKSEAIETWKRILRACDFFDSHTAWRDYVRVARLAVVSDFSGENEFLGQEILNLATRNNQPCHVLEKAKLSDTALKGVQGAIYLDQEPPGPEPRRKLLAYVTSGGLLVIGPKWGKPEGTLSTRDVHPRFSFYSLGKGGLAVAKEADPDPFFLVKDVPGLISHRHDLLRLFSANAGILYYTVAPAGNPGLVQLINYASSSRGAWPITVRIAERYRTARLRTIDQPEPRNIEIASKQGASQLFLPPIPVYAAVELGA